MKTITTFRRTAAMMVVFFAVTAISCQKENQITPDSSVNTPPPPPPVVTPPPPPVPQVSAKPRIITTKQDGSTIRSQGYEYDNNGKLLTYFSKGTNLDSVTISNNTIIFRIHINNGGAITQRLTLNDNKSFKSFFFSTVQDNFENDQSGITRILRSSNGSASQAIAAFDYINNNLNKMEADGTVISMNYYSNLPYQAGINELPLFYKPIQYFKIMEQEHATTTSFYNKLLHQVIIDLGIRKELHEYVYEFDTDRRVTKITDTITKTDASSSTQKVTESTISY